MKKILSIVLLIVAGYFIFNRAMDAPESNSLKRISKTYYQGEYQTAKSELEEFLKEYPNSTSGWAFLGLVSLELNDTLNAELGFKKGYELDAENDRAIVGLGVIERMRGNYEGARKYYEEATKVNPRNPNAYSSLLMLELKNENYPKAVELGEKARSLNLINHRPGILGNLAIAYHYNNQFQERDETLQKLETMNYQDLEYIKMIINGTVDLIDLL